MDNQIPHNVYFQDSLVHRLTDQGLILSHLLGLLLAMIPVSPLSRYFFVLGALANTAEGGFDVYVARSLAKFPRSYLVKDTQDGVLVYGVIDN